MKNKFLKIGILFMMLFLVLSGSSITKISGNKMEQFNFILNEQNKNNNMSFTEDPANNKINNIHWNIEINIDEWVDRTSKIGQLTFEDVSTTPTLEFDDDLSTTSFPITKTGSGINLSNILKKGTHTDIAKYTEYKIIMEWEYSLDGKTNWLSGGSVSFSGTTKKFKAKPGSLTSTITSANADWGRIEGKFALPAGDHEYEDTEFDDVSVENITLNPTGTTHIEDDFYDEGGDNYWIDISNQLPNTVEEYKITLWDGNEDEEDTYIIVAFKTESKMNNPYIVNNSMISIDEKNYSLELNIGANYSLNSPIDLTLETNEGNFILESTVNYYSYKINNMSFGINYSEIKINIDGKTYSIKDEANNKIISILDGILKTESKEEISQTDLTAFWISLGVVGALFIIVGVIIYFTVIKRKKS
ncbi:MAG: hypothetical protein HRS50_01835 [Mycoplasmataceae bacterium]|nr:hypothetical protein [Mycoplasmataceae bacterium]